MTDITASFGNLFLPFKAILFYREEDAKNIYIESYDMDERGYACNAHPLSVRESQSLAKALNTQSYNEQRFLQPAGLLPKQVLYFKTGAQGFAVWHTPAQKTNLLFKETLGIPSGTAAVPALLWKATKERLHIYALKTDTPESLTPLFHAPFFNVYADGSVCMGSVNVEIGAECSLELFMQQWQNYFWSSYFSHLIEKQCPVKGNIVQLWQGLVGSKRKFPRNVLLKNGYSLKNLIR